MLSVPHMIVVFIIVLVVFGPQKLPELARGLGKLMAEFRKASTDFKSAFEEEMRDLERQAREAERRKLEAASAAATTTHPQPAILTTPAEVETQSSGTELASAATGATEAIPVELATTDGGQNPVVAPVSESTVARETENNGATPNPAQTPEVTGGEELQAKAQKATTED